MRHTSCPEWALSVGACGHACAGWPAIETNGKGKGASWFKLGEVRSPEDLPWLVVTDLAGWLVQPVKWLSPWGQAAYMGLKQPKALELRGCQ